MRISDYQDLNRQFVEVTFPDGVKKIGFVGVDIATRRVRVDYLRDIDELYLQPNYLEQPRSSFRIIDGNELEGIVEQLRNRQKTIINPVIDADIAKGFEQGI